jgi:hypothetical protein
MQDLGRFMGGLALAAGLVTSAWIGADALVRIKSQDQNITVTGSTKQRIVSDWIVWRSEVTVRAPVMADAYNQLAKNVPQVVEYLKNKGVKAEQMVVSSVSTVAFHPRDRKGYSIEDSITGYQMSQEITVRSAEVDRVTEISRGATELINQGILLESREPEYHYTKLGDLKILMLAEAAKDAKLRAEQIAASTGSIVGPLRSARMGVMQINPAGSSDTSGEGNNDITSLEKDVIAVVTSSFALN